MFPIVASDASAANLPAELYGEIFLYNVKNADSMQEGLAFALDYSWVCQSWRNSIVSYELLWSEVLFFDSNEGYTSLSLLETIVARCKATTLLSIEASCAISQSSAFQERRRYLLDIIASNWHRIRHLRLTFVERVCGISQLEEIKTILCTRAPHLQMFDVRLYDGYGSFLQLEPSILFDDAAPSLSTFTSRGIHFAFNAPWLYNLTSFTTSRPSGLVTTMKETLDTLERMSNLQYLEIGHRVLPHAADEQSPQKYIFLPAVTHLVIEQPIRTCASLMSSIQPSACGCLTSFSAGLISRQQDQNGIFLENLLEISLDRARRMFLVEAFSSISVNFDAHSVKISVAHPQFKHRIGTPYHTEKSRQCVYFTLRWDNESSGYGMNLPSRDYTEHIPEIEFALGHFPAITTLQIIQMPANTMDLLSRFTSITTLEINIDVILRIPLLGYGEPEDLQDHLFPHLRELRVNLLPFRSVYGDGDLIPEILSFINDRALSNMPIHRLDLVGPKLDAEKSVCRRFSNINNLQVTWKGAQIQSEDVIQDVPYIYRIFLFIWGLIFANVQQ